MHLIFVRLGVFHFFLRKKVQNAPKLCTFGCIKNNNNNNNNNKNPTNPPEYSEIALEGNTTIFFYWVYCVIPQLFHTLHKVQIV